MVHGGSRVMVRYNEDLTWKGSRSKSNKTSSAKVTFKCFFLFFFTSVIFKNAAVLEMMFPCVSIAPLGFPEVERSGRSREVCG